VSRNPSLSKQLFGYAILGFALSEAMALFALMVAFFILFSDGHHASSFVLSLPWCDGDVRRHLTVCVLWTPEFHLSRRLYGILAVFGHPLET
jgi:hypothetical protein